MSSAAILLSALRSKAPEERVFPKQKKSIKFFFFFFHHKNELLIKLR